MGMFGEIHAAFEAERLQKVLDAARASVNSDIIAFTKKHILPLYNDAVGESWGSYNAPKESDDFWKSA